MAQTFNPALDALSLQRGVEGKGLQPSRGSSRAVCGQETSTGLHPLSWQHSQGEVHLGCLEGEASSWFPVPPHGCEVLWNQHCRDVQPSRCCGAPSSSPGPWVAQLRLSSAPQSSPSRPPAPLPKSRQPFLHVAFQSPQATVLSSKAPGSLSCFGGCSSHV